MGRTTITLCILSAKLLQYCCCTVSAVNHAQLQQCKRQFLSRRYQTTNFWKLQRIVVLRAAQRLLAGPKIQCRAEIQCFDIWQCCHMTYADMCALTIESNFEKVNFDGKCGVVFVLAVVIVSVLLHRWHPWPRQ